MLFMLPVGGTMLLAICQYEKLGVQIWPLHYLVRNAFDATV
jgi:hypothetical protein